MSRNNDPLREGSRSLASIKDSIAGLPNTPGFRPSNLTLIERSIAAERKQELSRPSTSIDGRPRTAMSFYDDPEYFRGLAEVLKPYPSTASSFGDLSGRYSLRSQKGDRQKNQRNLPFATFDHVPSYVVSSETVCRVFAYCVDHLPENTAEPERVRRVEIIFYQSDETLEIKEVKVANSGLVPIALKRHRVFKAATDGQYDNQAHFTIADCFSGAVLNIYNTLYTVTDADNFTRRFMNNVGVEFGPAEEVPTIGYDPSASWRTLPSPDVERRALESRQASAQGRKFYELNSQVLRFYGAFKENTSDGTMSSVRIHYFLSDDTIEIISNYGKNDGRDHVPKFLKRMRIRLPATEESDIIPGGSLLMSSTFEDPSDPAIRPYYSWTDFQIGGKVRFAGISILLLDADHFTRQFFHNNGTPLGAPIVLDQPVKRKYSIKIPPHNGIGSEEDSLQTCKGSLMPKPPKKDGAKAANFSGQILRFKAKFSNPSLGSANREFVIQGFLEDDTIQIQEIPVRNSGFAGGKFLARGKHNDAEGKPLKPSDFFIGARVKVRCHEFDILDADERTLKHMEHYFDLWPQSNLGYIQQRLRLAQGSIRVQAAKYGDAAIGYESARGLLSDSGLKLTLQESITLFRAIDPSNSGFIRVQSLI